MAEVRPGEESEMSGRRNMGVSSRKGQATAPYPWGYPSAALRLMLMCLPGHGMERQERHLISPGMAGTATPAGTDGMMDKPQQL